jgi:hypothetical protein
VAVADGVRGADPVEVDVDHPRRMRPVDERVDPAVLELGNDFSHGEDERRRARDVIQQHQPRAGPDRGQDDLARRLA